MMKDPPPAVSPPPPPRRRGLAAALAAFMEARNIFWGELVGGVLIVGCSIALVITLWDTLAESPLFKFCTFVGADAVVTGAGLYTLRKWKLESASRGLLLIALLLAPLALLAMLVPAGAGGRGVLPPEGGHLHRRGGGQGRLLRQRERVGDGRNDQRDAEPGSQRQDPADGFRLVGAAVAGDRGG